MKKLFSFFIASQLILLSILSVPFRSYASSWTSAGLTINNYYSNPVGEVITMPFTVLNTNGDWFLSLDCDVDSPSWNTFGLEFDLYNFGQTHANVYTSDGTNVSYNQIINDLSVGNHTATIDCSTGYAYLDGVAVGNGAVSTSNRFGTISATTASSGIDLFTNPGNISLDLSTITSSSDSTQNVTPVVNTPTISVNPILVNNAIALTATFTDSNTSDTHTAYWIWGDGNTSAVCPPNIGECNITESNGSGTVTGTHTYTSAGVYPVTLVVTDNAGASGSSTFQYVSIYNPTSQGIFSAGQVFTSPAGALSANSNATGNVRFGLSYKYQGTVPTGNRQFSMDFKSANFHFNATTVNSLVISNGIGTLTGTGTLNGSGTYNFLVTGSDSANTIRIQITDTLGNVLYDTQPGAATNVLPSTSVSGNVIAH